jgi:hypothetical protein
VTVETPSSIAKTRDGKGRVEVVGFERAGRTRWIYAHWYNEGQETGQAGEGVDGPYPSRSSAQEIARQRFDLDDFHEVPAGEDPLSWEPRC